MTVCEPEVNICRLFTYDAVLTDYMYSYKNNRTLNIDNTDEIVIVTTAFIDVYIFS